MTKKSVLLTGATGFLGSSLAIRLVSEGYHLTILKRSFTPLCSVQDDIDWNVVKYNPPDAIFRDAKKILSHFCSMAFVTDSDSLGKYLNS